MIDADPLPRTEPSEVAIPLERDLFLRTLLGHLAATLQQVVGNDEASGFLSVVGQELGDEINQSYREALSVPRLTREQVANVLVDLKRRIQGEFYVAEQDDGTIALGNRVCPFGDKVLGRPALCMMTSNVFGVIVSENLGYARVVIERAIARGDSECRVLVHLQPPSDSDSASGREYHRS